MKFINYSYEGTKHLGVMIDENNIVELKCITERVQIETPRSMNQLVDSFDDKTVSKIKEVLDSEVLKDTYISLTEVQVLAPIENPKRNIFCLGKNYMDHAKETKGLPGGSDDIPQFPIYFAKVASPAIGPGGVIVDYPEYTNKVDYEVELALVIGKDGIDISKNDAEDHIFGYTIVNDISARNIQRKHGQWFKGKSLDTYCPMGPVLVHKSALPFPIELDIQCSINDELRQNSNTRQLIFDIPEIIHDLSKGMYLRKGDIIITGTPAGVGLGFKPFKFLKAGDKIKCWIEGIGTLENTYGHE